jgi:hypothetical protein
MSGETCQSLQRTNTRPKIELFMRLKLHELGLFNHLVSVFEQLGDKLDAGVTILYQLA